MMARALLPCPCCGQSRVEAALLDAALIDGRSLGQRVSFVRVSPDGALREWMLAMATTDQTPEQLLVDAAHVIRKMQIVCDDCAAAQRLAIH